MIICGIDPGIYGALAILAPGGLRVLDMPTLMPRAKRVIDEIELARLIDAAGHIDHAFVEVAHPRPLSGVVNSFVSGKGYGVVRGILRAHFIQLHDIQPQRWKAAHGIPAGAGKDASRAKAKELFQREAGLFVRAKDDGRAEASLIAHYGVMMLGESVAA